jgi:lipoprotein-anchoring transpeptidase ErfK/SrfK
MILKSIYTEIKQPSRGNVLWLSLLFIIPVIAFSLYYATKSSNEPEPSAQPMLTSVNRTGDVPDDSVEKVSDNQPQIEKVSDNQPQDEVQPCATPPINSKIRVDISDQQLYLHCSYADGKEEVKTYSVSTSKYGIGNKAGSDKTPLGQHYIKRKIGDGAPEGTIFKARKNTGKIAEMNAPGAGDLVTTRIMWLSGLESGKNSGSGIDSHKRYIYIHGTAEEEKIGTPASHGCVRMYNRDAIDLFERVSEGTQVDIEE